MANTFTRFPRPGGDQGVGALFNEAQLNAVLGTLSGKIYNSGGVLYVPLCKIGIDNGSFKGIADIDTVTSVSLAGCSNSTWLKVEMTVSGSSVAFAAADMAGETDPTEIPATVKAAYDGRKGGFYLDPEKRLVALAWLNSSGVLLAVINFDGQKIWASQIGLHTGTIHEQQEPGKGFPFNIGDWDMDTTVNINVLWSLDVFYQGISGFFISIRDDADTARYPLNCCTGGTMDGGVESYDTVKVNIVRVGGGRFDSVNFDTWPSYNRGEVIVYMRDF